MSSLVKKRIIKIALASFLFGLLYLADYFYQSSINASSFLTGWIMLVILCMLILFNIRKKLSFLPLGSAYQWAQLHIYLGFVMFALFFVHISSMPSGSFEILLSILFILLSLSGFYGLYISRVMPPRLANNSEYVIYERIPGLREKIRLEVEDLVNQSRDENDSKALVEFYNQILFNFLSTNKDFWRHVIDGRSVYANWERKLAALEKYLSTDEVSDLNDIRELVNQKIDIDNQYATRSILKYWLFFHIPLSYILMISVLFHTLLVYSFSWSGL